MACLTLATGRSLPCTSSVGGIKNVLITTFGDLGDLTISSTDGEVTAWSGTPTLFKYEVDGATGLEQGITASRENGSIFYTQTLTVTLKRLDKETQFELENVLKNRLSVIVEDYNGNYLLMGAVHGVNSTGGSIATGQAFGDLTGFSALTFEAQETRPAHFVDDTLVEADIDSTQIDPA